MRAIIYGIGKRYTELCQEFDKNKVEVVGFADGNINVIGSKIKYNNAIYEIGNIGQFDKDKYDKILVTTKKYYKEIQKQLMEKGFEKEKILLVEELFARNLFHIQCFCNKTGIEIGGPTELFSYIYRECKACDVVDFCSYTVWRTSETNEFRYADRLLGRNFIAEATDMYQIKDESYDFVLSSNNLEHIANPLKALQEFSRVVKIGGTVLLLVPMKDRCFDHNRSYTTFEHLTEDYFNGIGEDDLTHLDEIIEKHDYDMDVACGGRDKFIKRAKKNVENRCLHHHVFDEETLKKAFAFAELDVIDFSEVQDNWLIIGKRRGKYD